MNTDLPQKGFYRHYKYDPKGELYNYTYEVIGIARNTEEKSFSVLYRPLYESAWMPPAEYQSRPLDMFVENVEKDGASIPRFTMISDPELISELEGVRDSLYG